MKKIFKQLVVIFSLIFISALIYSFQIFIFKKPDDTMFYLLQDFAFLPLQILIVTFIITNILKTREKNILQNKMYMVIGAFFSQLGLKLIKDLAIDDLHIKDARQILNIESNWTEKELMNAKKLINKHNFVIKISTENLIKLKNNLLKEKPFLMGLLENQNLLEHELFSDLLWTICHLTEELEYRENLDNLSKKDYEHLCYDIKRIYYPLITQWLQYINHLKFNYPFIYSLVIRTNPFNENAKVEL